MGAGDYRLLLRRDDTICKVGFRTVTDPRDRSSRTGSKLEIVYNQHGFGLIIDIGFRWRAIDHNAKVDPLSGTEIRAFLVLAGTLLACPITLPVRIA